MKIAKIARDTGKMVEEINVSTFSELLDHSAAAELMYMETHDLFYKELTQATDSYIYKVTG